MNSFVKKITQKRLSLYLTVAFLSIGFLSLDKISSSPFKRIDLSGFAQGTTWHMTYYAVDSLVTKKQVDSILSVIDSSMSIYKPYSLIVAFNNSKTGITIDEHLKKVVAKSLDTYRQTNGLFDITVFPLVEAWGFAAKPLHETPDSATIHSLLSCISSRYLQLRANTLMKLKPCVKVDVNGIAQGYSVDVVANFFEEKGIRNYIVEIGGEIRCLEKSNPVMSLLKLALRPHRMKMFHFLPWKK